MKASRLLALICLASSCFFLALATAAQNAASHAHQQTQSAKAETPEPPDFDVQGIGWTECACTKYACPCRSNGHPDTKEHSCDAADFAYIQKGHWGNQKLDGLKVIIIGDLIDSSPERAYANVYFDNKTTPQQRKAFMDMFGYMFSNWGGSSNAVKSVKVVPLRFTESTDKQTYTLTIPGILQEKAFLKRDAQGNPVHTLPAMDQWGNEIHYADNLVLKYHDKDLKREFDHSGRQANFKFFHTTREMYVNKELLIQHGDMSGSWTDKQKEIISKANMKVE
ncbi:MAG TPA: DUF1326 domain-containing protein [Terriglobales bacterium]|nr:DUF1326 domain-containing protein [Terriglobales bacterium]